MTRRLIVFAGLLLIPPFEVWAEDWPQMGRTAARNAVSPEKNPPVDWDFGGVDEAGRKTPGRNLRWSAEGFAEYSTIGEPVIADGLVWVATNNKGGAKGADGNPEDGAVLVCLDEKTGKERYRYFSSRVGNRQSEYGATGLNCSPFVEGDRLWFVSNRGEVICLDIGPLRRREGEPKIRWKLDMLDTLGVRAFGRDWFALRRCSVTGYQEFVYVSTGNGVDDGHEKVPAPDAPSLVCLRKEDGKVVWTDNSPGKEILQGQPSSPLLVEVAGRTQVVAGQGDGWVRSFDAHSGKLIWKFDTNPIDEPRVRVPWKGNRNWPMATPVFVEGRIYLGTGQDGEAGEGPAWFYCIDPTKTGDISPEVAVAPGKGKANPNSGMVWRFGGPAEKGKRYAFCRTLSNAVVAEGLVVVPCFDGRVHCFDAATGRRYWEVDTEAHLVASPLIVDGMIYVGHADGVHILSLSKEAKTLATIECPWRIRYSPVFANGTLYLLSGWRLYAIANKN